MQYFFTLFFMRLLHWLCLARIKIISFLRIKIALLDIKAVIF